MNSSADRPVSSFGKGRKEGKVDPSSIGCPFRTTAIVGLFVLLFILLPAVASAAGTAWGPWSVSDDAPVLMMKADRRTAPPAEKPVPSVASTPFLWLLSFYQTTIGPTVSGRCPMYPTCSQYSVQAIKEHGPVIGIVMTADRLIHEHDEMYFAPLVKVGSRYRYSDPVKDNDFWWYHE